MAIYTPYTYLIGWTTHNKWYYGVRYAEKSNCLYETGCHPDDLWVTYFTSSDYVTDFILKNGEPDIIQIRKTFDSKESAAKWEDKVLKRINAHKRLDFLNKHAGKAIILSEEDFERISKQRKEKWNSLSPEEQQNIRDERSKRTKSFWNSMCKTKRMLIVLKSNMKREQNRKNNWDKDFREQLKKKKQKSWETSDKRAEHVERTRLRRLSEEASKSEKDRQEFSEKMKDAYWSRSKEEIELHHKKQSIATKLSYEKNPELLQKRAEQLRVVNLGKIYVNKDGKSKFIYPHQLDDFIAQGWSRGRGSFKKKDPAIA